MQVVAPKPLSFDRREKGTSRKPARSASVTADRYRGVSLCGPMVIADAATGTIAPSQPAPAGDRLACFNADFEEFGEERIVDLVRAQADRPAVTMVEALVDAVQRHSGPAQSDDFTVVVARGRGLRVSPPTRTATTP